MTAASALPRLLAATVAALACVSATGAAPADAPDAANDTATCTTDRRMSAFPIRLIKCNIADLTCFREGRYVYGGGADGVASGDEPRCTGLWTQGPCDKFEWLVVDKARFYATGYIRTTCAPAALCPKGYVLMGFDGNCYSAKEASANCPKVRGFRLTHNVFGEGQCVCGKRPPLPARYCDTVAVGGARAAPPARSPPVPRP
ncbi:hypothetical protein R5R35_007606 [Gryllus longicercus]|uniref:DUF4789 domain-containing protein n=1 Tax=Gryllus longicercus TaxID=2509291 RepID=A0AAN9Z7M1_9ORTH